MDEGGRGGSDEVNEVDEVVSTQRDDWWEEVDSATSENDDDDDDDDDDCESDDGDSELGPTELEDLRADSGVPLEDLVGPGWPSLAPTEEPDMLDPFTERAFLPLFPVLDRRGGGGLAPSARLPPRLARRMHGRTPGPKFPRSWVATFVLDRSREDADPLLLPFLELKYQQPSPSFSFEAGFSMGRFIMAHHRARIGYNQFWYDHDLALVEDNQFPVTYAYRYQREEYNAFQADDRLTVAAASCGPRHCLGVVPQGSRRAELPAAPLPAEHVGN
ncbi:hypothetical protein DFJ73DRAFT_67588 [Zopfochytrium polystomum]|nr:hypothetical protein DFJ73DRAFT_67588 [Zopfochytrium polystomum]